VLGLIFGMQVENRLTGGKSVLGNHGLQIFYMALIQRIEFQDKLLCVLGYGLLSALHFE
jgi:hypothetical protein